MPYILQLILVAALITFLTRALPFLLFGRGREVPAVILYLGRVLPPAIMVILVVYCLRHIRLGTPEGFLPGLLASVAVIALHLWKRNSLLSIGGGTLLYMLLLYLL